MHWATKTFQNSFFGIECYKVSVHNSISKIKHTHIMSALSLVFFITDVAVLGYGKRFWNITVYTLS